MAIKPPLSFPKREGDPLRASEWNELQRLARRELRGENVVADEFGWVIAPPQKAAAAAGLTAAFAMITSRAGSSPPYRYSAQQATMTIDGEWSTVDGGITYDNVFNIEEQGAGGQWVNPLLVGDAVLILHGPDANVDAYVCLRAHYRGTY